MRGLATVAQVKRVQAFAINQNDRINSLLAK
jgi:hypothetical protein